MDEKPQAPWKMARPTDGDPMAMAAQVLLNTPPPWSPPPPAVPKDIQDRCWAEVEANESPAKQAAIRWWLAGYSWRESASLAGFSNHNRLREAVWKYGLHDYEHRTDRIIRAHRVITDRCQEEMLARLEDPELAKDIEFRDLTIAAGVSTDKISAYENWSKNAGGAGGVMNAFEALAQAIIEGNVNLELKVTAADQAIDVTPQLPSEISIDAPVPKLKPWDPNHPSKPDPSDIG